MITIGFCTRQSNSEYIDHIIKSCGLDAKKVEVIEIVNTGDRSLTQCYNEIMARAKYNKIVFMHDDLVMETKQWGSKLLKLFEKNPEYGILGVAGTKYLAENGQWWNDKRKMYGRVAHTHEGKTWLSKYSQDIGQNIEEVVVVDGVFFAVDRLKVEHYFDESVKGFHFYDIDFCFKNYLSGVKIGVFTFIRVNHKSIGMTNQSWEDNRVEFAEKYKSNLPASIKKNITKGNKLKVLIAALNFRQYTGSELYVLELAKELMKKDCEVSICSNYGDPLASKAKKLGIKLYDLENPPGYKLGDGKWLLKMPNGDVPSTPKTLYRVEDYDFDVIHLNHKPVAEHLIRLYPNIPIVTSIHSEIIGLEEPVIHPQVKKFIAIRPEIKEHLINAFDIPEESIDIIYNPIDTTRFKPKPLPKKDKKRILFVGTIDYIRQETIGDLIIKTKEDNEELWIVGRKGESDYLPNMMMGLDHVKYFPDTANIETYVQQCDETAGIMLGRTTIEGWLCGKKGWIYDIDSTGRILSKKLADIPENINDFKAENVASKVLDIYQEILE